MITDEAISRNTQTFNTPDHNRRTFLVIGAQNTRCGAGGTDVSMKEIPLESLVQERDCDVLCLTETDTTRYEQYKSLNITRHQIYNSKEAYVRRRAATKMTEKKVRSLLLVRNGVFKSVDQIVHGVDDRAEVWLRHRVKSTQSLASIRSGWEDE